eukprot:gb/GECG01006050.1/.p1 GENE.gb/GECG01006050.1/~~gb/GECG01006050.1/.p1  ORF type:complete len:380 (+),score=59.45 gb/GECG01006050.1/:1-1140(+)
MNGVVRQILTLGLVLLSSRLDSTDPTVMLIVRTLYVIAQVTAISALYYTQRQVEAKQEKTPKIWVRTEEAKAKQMTSGGLSSMFQSVLTGKMEPSAATEDEEIDPEDFKESNYHDVELEKLSKDMNQAMFGVLIMLGLHLYMGLFIPLIIQVPSAAFNTLDNPVFKRHVLGHAEEKPYGELLQDPKELKDSKESSNREAVADVPNNSDAVPAESPSRSYCEEMEEAIYRSWETAEPIDPDSFDAIIKAKKQSIDFRTKNEGWTVLMIACGSPQNDKELIQRIIDMGADKTVTDDDGWTALHWACYHDCPQAIEALLENETVETMRRLLLKTCKEDKTAVALARENRSESCANILQHYVNLASLDLESTTDNTKEDNKSE